MNINLENKECRICFDNDVNSDFISPCLCNGTSKYVHISCLNTWRKINMNKDAYNRCMECKYEYKFKYKYLIEKNHYIFNVNQKICLLYIFSIPISLIYSSYDKDYSILTIIDFGQTRKTPPICIHDIYNNSFSCYNTCIYSILNESDFFSKFIFYLCFITFFNLILLSICYYKINKKTIKRYKDFHNINKKKYHLWLLNIFKFLLFYYIIVYLFDFPQGIIGYMYINILLEPILFNKFLKLHNDTINTLNKDNPQTILSYHSDENTYNNDGSLNILCDLYNDTYSSEEDE
tara:strand:+ start:1019 stop:1891 length:873 start_codon:yes stop_codon:yes gene_type:complete